jgi:lipoprotein signal peptidase
VSQSKVTNALTTIGIIGGFLYAIKQDKKIGIVALYGIAFGLGGMLVGNYIDKFNRD